MNSQPAMPSREYELLSRIQPFCCENYAEAYAIATGDDAAVRRGRSDERLIITTDISVENVHFTLSTMSLEEIGYRSMVTNLSDCASMGAIPDSAFIQLVFPGTTDDLHKNIEDIYKGFSSACKNWEFSITGGDLSAGPAWVIGITFLGRVAEKDRVLTRKGIQDGDILWCTGVPGLSAAGFDALQKWGRNGVPETFVSLINKHIRPEPRISAGRLLAGTPEVHAMMDLSDGLSKDCRTLCYDNKVGLTIAPDYSLCPSAMVRLSRELSVPAEDWLLYGGEDYELLFTASPSFDPAELEAKTGCTFIKLGEFSKSINGVFYCNEHGLSTELEMRSWDHLKK